MLIGYFVVRLELGIAAKFALLDAAVTATMLVYHFGIRRFAMGRFITGMKPRPSASIGADWCPSLLRVG